MLYGQSAGSGSTAFHLVAPKRFYLQNYLVVSSNILFPFSFPNLHLRCVISKGLFSRAALESGPYARWTSYNMTVANIHYDAMVQRLGCTENGNSFLNSN